MKSKKIFLCLLVLTVIFSNISAIFEIAEAEEIKFSDVKESDWFYKYVKDMSENDIINGYEDGTYKPANSVKRAEVIKLIVSTIIENVGNGEIYWAEKYINTAIANGLIDNMEIDQEYFNAEMTREEVATIVCRSLKYKGIEYSSDEKKMQENKIGDFNQISAEHLDDVLSVYASGIMQGNDQGLFNPQKPVIRSEISKVIAEYIKSIGINLEAEDVSVNDFSTSLSMLEEQNPKERFEIFISGKNVPDVKSVVLTYTDPETKKYKEIPLEKTRDSQDITRRINYIGTADFKTNIRYNFGYKITFANGEEKTYSNVKSVLYSDNTNTQGGLTLITGDFKITEPGAILISNNKIKNIGNEEILSYGIVKKICKDNEPKPILSKANLKEWTMAGICYVYKVGLKTTYNTNTYSELKYGEQMYYAAFIEVSGGKYYFGDIKTTRGYTVPHIFNTTSTVIDEETVIVEVEYTSPIPIITHDRKSIEYFVGQNGAAYIQYWGEPLSSADVKINKDNNKMSLYFTDLNSKYQMDIRLELFSDYGKSENYAFSTPKSENYPKVIVDSSGNVIKTNFNEKLKIINIIKNAQDLSGKINCIKGENGEIVKVEKTGVFYHPLIAIVEYKDGARTYTYNIQID